MNGKVGPLVSELASCDNYFQQNNLGGVTCILKAWSRLAFCMHMRNKRELSRKRWGKRFLNCLC
jgi:hypothetical protein